MTMMTQFDFVILACAFLVLERLLQLVLSMRRWIENRAQRGNADAEYAAMLAADRPQFEEFEELA
jgi:hypothetical protein